MIPIYLDPLASRIALVGRGDRAVSRLEWLVRAGAAPDVWSDAPSESLVAASGQFLRRRLPAVADLRGYQLVWVADLPANLAEPIAATARAERVLINVEDVKPLCDFHSPAVVRRGALTLAAGTGGASPAVAKAVRERLEQTFPPEWGDALDVIARAREDLREKGATGEKLMTEARAVLASRGLVPQ